MRELITAFFAGIASAFRTAPPVLADRPTAGPPRDEHPIVPISEVVKANWGEAGVQGPGAAAAEWTAGWYLHAKQTPAHPGRVGGTILPKAVVVHTTDMHPSAHDDLVRAWSTKPGAGNGAHFLIGRTAVQGVKQLCPITRNANHAGGSNGHGWWKTGAGKLIHPNTVSVGIEIDNAGKLRKTVRGLWVHPDSGRIIPPEDVYLGPRGTGWHKVNDYQLFELSELLRNLESCLGDLPPGTRISPNGDPAANGVPWAAGTDIKVTGHVSLDPANKNDPGPQVIAWLKEHA